MLSESPGIARATAVESHQDSSPRYPTLLVLFSVETIAINLARLPESMRFDRFAFCDQGANLTLQYLIAGGLRPVLDFGYTYGLLPALFGHLWFGLFGATPWAYQAAMLIVDLVCACAIAQILSRLKVGAVSIALAFIALGYAFQASYVNFAHALEAMLLCLAIAAQARGSYSSALAWVTAAVFAKPSMAYVYGLLLVILIARDLGRSGSDVRQFVRALAPAAFVFLSLGTILSLVYGSRTLIHTVFPFEGASHYRAMNFGLMAAGRQLWDPTRRRWILYVIDVAGFWILSGIVLFATVLLRLRHWNAGKPTTPHYELVATCAILHFAFLVLFFGNQWSWVYYSYLLVIGTAIAVDLGPTQRRIGLILCVTAVISYTDLAFGTYRAWHTTTRDATTAGLWAPEDERKEWLQVLGLTHGNKVVILDSMGAAQLLFPSFENPVSLFLLPGLMQPDDVRRTLDQLAKAQVAIVPITIKACGGVPDAPEFREALKSFDVAWEGKHFEVFRRRTAP